MEMGYECGTRGRGVQQHHESQRMMGPLKWLHECQLCWPKTSTTTEHPPSMRIKTMHFPPKNPVVCEKL